MTTPSVNNLRRRAAKVGLRFYKSNWRKDSVDNQGGYRIIEVAQNICVEGFCFDCDLEDVQRVIENLEAA